MMDDMHGMGKPHRRQLSETHLQSDESARPLHRSREPSRGTGVAARPWPDIARLTQNRLMMPPQTPTFAQAKIQPPRQRLDLIDRPPLEEALGLALERHPLTLLVAPAGYGKTAALSRAVRALPEGCALVWLSVDEDDQLQRFLACLTMALAPFGLPWRVAPDALGTLALAERGPRAVADELVNALALSGIARGLIAIDDAHRIADPKVFEVLQAVIDHLPVGWSLAMASRTEPPLSLARWRARGELAEFRLADLRFTPDDIVRMLSGRNDEASGSAVRELLDRTGGWPAGLRLMLASKAGLAESSTGTPTQRHLFDYLASEVLADMPEELRRFMVLCSVLPEWTAARCARVSQMDRADFLLEEVERRGLFVSILDAPVFTLRLHDLFRDFLENRLERDMPEALPLVLQRAADGEPDWVRSVGFLTRAGGWDRAAEALEQAGPDLIGRGGGPALEQMLSLFPVAELERRPGLQLLSGLAAFQRFDFDTQMAAMRRAAKGYRAQGEMQAFALASAFACNGMLNTGQVDDAVAQLGSLREMALDDTARSFVCFSSAWGAYAQGEMQEVSRHIEAMLDALERSNDARLWDRCFYVSILVGLPGMRPLLERFAAGAQRLTSESPSQLRAAVRHVQAWLALSQGRADEAALHLDHADEDCRWLGHPRILQTENWLAHTLIDAVRGHREQSYQSALANQKDMQASSYLSNRQSHEYEEIFAHIRAAWLFNDATTLRTRVADLIAATHPFEWRVAAMDRTFGLALVAMFDERFQEAAESLRPLAAADERGCFFPASQATLLMASAESRNGRLDDAAEVMRVWCKGVRSTGDLGGAMLAGPTTLEYLAALEWGDRLPPGDRVFLTRLAHSHPARFQPSTESTETRSPVAGTVPESAPEATPPDTDQPAKIHQRFASLTARELDVLARIAAGDSNKLIARAFDLSLHTVKRHVVNVLDKLGVDSRGRAAALWRDPDKI
jgi:LuxR family transcriptional regulator, maltose regulon positive regulatory protein